jgi:glycerol-3-phosphate dehydrogenase
MKVVDTEVLIIGGGILGTVVARELSRYKVETTLVEKEVDFGWGSTKASATVVCQGGDCLEFRKEYRNSKFVWESIPLMEPLCRELNVPFKRIGSLSIIRNNAELVKYQKMKSLAEKWLPDVEPQQWISRDALREMEPHLTKDVIGALYDPKPAVTDPVRLSIALAENARDNGTNIMLGAEVLSITAEVDQFEVQTTQGLVRARFIVNAAGVFADKIAAMVNADDFVLYPVKGWIGVLDKKAGGLVNHVITARPSRPGQLIFVNPTVHDNIFFGIPLQLNKRGDYSSTRRMAQEGFSTLQELAPDASEKDIINSFAGYIMYRNYELGWHECVVAPSRSVPRFINLCIGFPGVSASPAAAKETVRLLIHEGLKAVENPKFKPNVKALTDFSEASDADKAKLIAKDSRYGHVVCRCETVTEGEIVEAIKRGATTMDGVKYRTRAGMGRCQGGFCGPRVAKILARELNVPEEQITKKGEESRLLLYKSKELLAGGNE